MNARLKVLLSASALAITTFALPVLSHAAEVDSRLHNETARINQGAASGQLTPAEAARLRTHKRQLRHEVNRMRARNGGTLTARQRARVNRQETRLSHHVYRHKHNASVAY